jgi:dolichol-phosphate hexosyltransferase
MPKRLVILIPCFNEEKGIAKVINSIPYDRLGRYGYTAEVIVIDNNSKDKTAKIARRLGAKVIHEKKQGKGYALIAGLKSLPPNTDVVAMIDGDDSYDVSEIWRLIEPIDSNFCDCVIGSRLHGKITENSMKYFNRVGNWTLTFLVRLAYRGNVTDVCTGFFAWRKEVIDMLVPYLKSNGFSIEMEMITKMAKMGISVYSVPITYAMRQGKSSLSPLKDGPHILYTWLRHLAWKPDSIVVEETASDPKGYRDG